MRGVRLIDWEWVARIEYRDLNDADLHISSIDCPDILSAIARVHRHCREQYPYEIVAIQQNIINRTDASLIMGKRKRWLPVESGA